MDTRFFLYFVVPLSLGIVITLVGAILLFVDSRRNKKTSQTDDGDWATIGGKITAAHLGDRQAGDTYEPIIEYTYIVDNVEYQGNHIFPSGNASSKLDDAQEILDRHPVNTYVPIRYNPQTPNASALEPQPQQTNIIRLAGWVLTGFGICTCCFTTFMVLVIFGAAI